MRVFVTGTGRCGTVSFWRACEFITNYKSSHETVSLDLTYPDGIIEVNSQLRHSVTHLHNKYPKARWVHFIRSPETCIPSLAALGYGSVMLAYGSLFPT